MQIIAHSPPNLIETAHQELSEAPGLLDLPEHRLDDLLSQAKAAAAPGSPQTGSHFAHQGHFRQPTTPDRTFLAVACATWGEVACDAASLQYGEVRLVGKASVPETSCGLRPRWTCASSTSGTRAR